MRFQKSIITLAIFVAILPVLGIPLPWKEGLSVFVGLGIAVLTILSNHTLSSITAAMFATEDEPPTETEEKPEPQNQYQSDEPYHDAPDPEHIADNE